MSDVNPGPNEVSFLVRAEDPLHLGLPASTPAGEVHRGRTLFPPPFSAWQGMVRTRLLTASSLADGLGDRSAGAREARTRLIGTPEALPKGWQLDGPWPTELSRTEAGERAEAWFPVPRFLLRLPQKEHDEPQRYTLARVLEGAAAQGLSSDLGPEGMLPVGAPDRGRLVPAEGWVSASTLLMLLRGEWRPGRRDPEPVHRPLPPFVEREQRAGLAVDGPTAAAREGLLYFREQLRFAPEGGLAGGLAVPYWPDEVDPEALVSGLGRLGSGSGSVSFDARPQPTVAWRRLLEGAHLPREVAEGGRAWLMLATAADLGSEPLRPELPLSPDVEISVRAAMLGRSLVLGGLSIRGRGRVVPRPNRPYTPAGSVWLLELRGGTGAQRADALRALHNRCTLGRPEERPFGAGRTFVGIGIGVGD